MRSLHLSMSLPYFVVALVVAVVAPPRALAWDDVSNPFVGGELWHTVTDVHDLWVLKTDLCAAGVSVRTTADGERGRTVPSFANLVGAQAAVNGDFFGSGYNTDGPAAHDGVFWGAGVNHTYVTPLAFGPAHVDIPHHQNEGPTPAWAKEVVGGHPTLLDDGTVVGSPGDPLCDNRHPRTAVGVSQDHRTLIVAVVDGRRPGAAGMTCDELAFVMAAHGAFDAVNMDGGGSSTMVVNGSVKNQPSDGQPRTVGNHLGIFAVGSGASPQCPDYVAPECAGDANRQSCDGTFITSCSEGAPVAYGDCGFFGAGCSTQGGAAHCVHPYCLMNLDGAEDGTFCQEGTNIVGTCALGVYSEGDCGFFGATCSEKGGAGHCVHPFCPPNLAGDEDGSFCTDAGLRATCTLGAYVEETCAADAPCQENSAVSASCGAPAQEGEGEGDGGGDGEGEGDGGEGEGGEGEGDSGEGEAEARDADDDRRDLPSSIEDPNCASGAPGVLLSLCALLGHRRRSRLH